MGAPQIIVLVLFAINLLAAASLHGQSRDDSFDFWSTLTSNAVLMGLLIWGGFFNG